MIPPAIVSRGVPPHQSRIADWYDNADLLDTYVVALPANYDPDIRIIVEAILGQPTLWFKTLLLIRDGVARRFDLKTTGDLLRSNHDGDRIDFFPVLSSSDGEVILGEDDQHLDFRLSLQVQRMIDGPDLVFATTAVRCHNRLGHAYLAAIAPFHRLVVHSKLRRAVKTGFVLAGTRGTIK